MQVTGKTKTGEEKQLIVEIRDVEIVKPKIEKSIKKRT